MKWGKMLTLFCALVTLVMLLVTPATASPTEFTVYVTANTLNVRSGPGISYNVIDHVVKDDVLTVAQVQGPWYRIVQPAGWVYSGWTTRIPPGSWAYSVEMAGGESSILDYETNFMLADGQWATQDLREKYGRELGLPDGGCGWQVPQIAANGVGNCWHIGFRNISVAGNLMIPHPLDITGRGHIEFTAVGTNLNCDYFGTDCKPALHFAGAGSLTITDLNTGETACFCLNTGKIPIAMEPNRPIKVVFDGYFFEAGFGPSSPAAEGRELRWPFAEIDADFCN